MTGTGAKQESEKAGTNYWLFIGLLLVLFGAVLWSVGGFHEQEPALKENLNTQTLSDAVRQAAGASESGDVRETLNLPPAPRNREALARLAEHTTQLEFADVFGTATVIEVDGNGVAALQPGGASVLSPEVQAELNFLQLLVAPEGTDRRSLPILILHNNVWTDLEVVQHLGYWALDWNSHRFPEGDYLIQLPQVQALGADRQRFALRIASPP